MDRPLTALCLPSSLPYPLTVHRLHFSPNSTVRKTQAVLTYSFVPAKPDDDGQRERQVASWDSPVEGELLTWNVKEGQLWTDPSQPIVYILEPCTHDVQWDGMCAVCGKDLTAVDYTGFSDMSRATISMVHDVGGLTVSLEEAHRLESATTSRLLTSKKLSLIVDLDQTIVHATVDPTVGEWLNDSKNPNYSALKGVKRFKLSDEMPARKPPGAKRMKQRKEKKGKEEDGTGDQKESREEVEEERAEEEEDEDGCWYYIKMRPGLPDFLRRIAEIYEMHVYTMGTRAYAKEVCKVIDPDGGLFGGRILSRDESGSMTRKSLQRLFPCDTNMVVIIDDRADVWDGSPNLVKVIPYEFFVGIGDINAAFLPKKKELVPPPVPTGAAPSTSGPSPSPSPASTPPSSADSPASINVNEASPRDQRSTTPETSPEAEAADSKASPSFSSSPEPTTIADLLVTPSPTSIVSPTLSEASTALALTIHDQMESRPLQKAAQESSHAHHLQQQQQQQLLVEAGGAEKRHGEEVGGMEDALGEAGEEDEDEEEEAVLKDDDRELDRLYDILSTVHSTFFEEHEAKGSSDVATIIPSLKSRTLRSTHLVFSGLVALGTRPQDSEYWKLATAFGAKCSAELHSGVTHLVANQAGTAKVHSARRNPRIQVVYPQWLLDSVAQWTRLSEASYLLPEPPSTSTPGSPIRPSLSEEDEGAAVTVEDNPVVISTGAGAHERGKGTGETLEDDDDDDLGPELDMGEIDWGEAMAEMDDLLNETDDDATDLEVESDAGSDRPRKRARGPSTGDEGEGEGEGGGEGKGRNHGAQESPLQKRVKTARSRSSRLKTSLSAAAPDGPPESDGPATDETDAGSLLPQERGNGATTRTTDPTPEASQASSSVDSDDEFLASMAAEVEKGFEA
ncbi:hypothetical protein JCM21900_006561 [Sporobolomyces salmonicolor]